MSRKIVHVVGTGTIGEPLIGLLCDFKTDLGIDEVTFNRKEQTANSKTLSKFESEGTEIYSEGFSIIQQGDIILFEGKTSLVLNQ